MVIMSVHQQGYNHIRLSTVDDVIYLAPRLRYEDKREIIRASGELPYKGLLDSFRNSTACFTIYNFRDEPVSMFGIRKLENQTAIVWLLATDGLKEIQKPFLKQNRFLIKFLAQQHRILWNFVDCENHLHIKWLKWCGFKFLRKVKFGVLQKPFYEIICVLTPN